MREHMGLYRGKRIDNGDWVEGYFVFRGEELSKDSDTNSSYILVHDELGFVWHKVDPDTVGECTGLKDKNGKLIFEGDVIAQNWYDYDEPAEDSFGEVVFCEYDSSFSVMDVGKGGIIPLGRCHAYHWEAEIIGNIHDNPELLKGGEG